jgi:DNA-binding MarR family transcriptional regulator
MAVATSRVRVPAGAESPAEFCQENCAPEVAQYGLPIYRGGVNESRPGTGDIPEDASAAAMAIFVVVGRLSRRLRALPGDSGLTPAQASVLVRLSKVDSATVGELAGAEQVSHQAMVKVAAALEQAGLVRREPDPADGRRQLLSLTETGRPRAQGERAARQEWLARAFAEHGTPEEIRAMLTAAELLGKVADSS